MLNRAARMAIFADKSVCFDKASSLTGIFALADVELRKVGQMEFKRNREP